MKMHPIKFGDQTSKGLSQWKGGPEKGGGGSVHSTLGRAKTLELYNDPVKICSFHMAENSDVS